MLSYSGILYEFVFLTNSGNRLIRWMMGKGWTKKPTPTDFELVGKSYNGIPPEYVGKSSPLRGAKSAPEPQAVEQLGSAQNSGGLSVVPTVTKTSAGSQPIETVMSHGKAPAETIIQTGPRHADVISNTRVFDPGLGAGGSSGGSLVKRMTTDLDPGPAIPTGSITLHSPWNNKLLIGTGAGLGLTGIGVGGGYYLGKDSPEVAPPVEDLDPATSEGGFPWGTAAAVGVPAAALASLGGYYAYKKYKNKQ